MKDLDLGHPRLTDEGRYFLKRQALYLQALDNLEELHKLAVSGKLTKEQLVDLDWIVRREAERHNHVRKELDKLDELLRRVIGAMWAASDSDEPIRGQLATGTPDIATGKQLPSMSKNPESYNKMLSGLGLSDEAIANKLFRISWDDLMNYLHKTYTEKGRRIPSYLGTGEEYTMYKLRLVTKQNNPLDLAPTPGKEDPV